MPANSSAERVIQDVRLLLTTVRDEAAAGRRPYISDVRRLVERALALRYAEYVQFLEKYGFMTLDRRSNLLALTRAGEEIVKGKAARSKALVADARYHFGDGMPAPSKGGSKSERLDMRFLKEQALGRGGLGTVYAGRLLSVDRPIAIKIMEGLDDLFLPDQHDAFRRRLELAVRAHAQLISPFIVQILDQNTRHKLPYYVMELATGGHLRQVLGNGPLPVSVAMRYFVQIATALQTAHAAGVLHRDLKPENVLFDAQGNVKLSDFGIIRSVEQGGGQVRQAYVGYGSVGYMAPETFRPGGQLGPQADIYALGILLYEMLVGTLPGRRSPMPSEVATDVPEDIDEIFDVMTQDQIERRPESVDVLMEMVWRSPSIVALFDSRQPPMFAKPPIELPGLAQPEPARVPDHAEESSTSVDQPPAPAPESSAPPALAVEASVDTSAASLDTSAASLDASAASLDAAAEELDAQTEPPAPLAPPLSADPTSAAPAVIPVPRIEPDPIFEPDPAYESAPYEQPDAALPFQAVPEAMFASPAPQAFDPDPTYASGLLPAELSPAVPQVVGSPAMLDDDDDSVVDVLDSEIIESFDENAPLMTGEGPDMRSSTNVTNVAQSATRKAIDEKLRRLRRG